MRLIDSPLLSSGDRGVDECTDELRGVPQHAAARHCCTFYADAPAVWPSALADEGDQPTLPGLGCGAVLQVPARGDQLHAGVERRQSHSLQSTVIGLKSLPPRMMNIDSMDTVVAEHTGRAHETRVERHIMAHIHYRTQIVRC